jgi:hypothetical protein
MPRNALIEAIHEARYDLQTCAEKDKPAARKRLYDFGTGRRQANPAGTD